MIIVGSARVVAKARGQPVCIQVRELTELEREEEEAKSVAAVCKCYDDDNGEEEEEEENELITTCFESMQTAFFRAVARQADGQTNLCIYHGQQLVMDTRWEVTICMSLSTRYSYIDTTCTCLCHH
jgi:hypothetical protein